MGTTVAPAHSAPQVGQRPLGAGAGQDRDAIAGLHAEGGQPVGDLVSRATDVRVREGVGVAGIRRAHRHARVRGDGRPEHRRQGLGARWWSGGRTAEWSCLHRGRVDPRRGGRPRGWGGAGAAGHGVGRPRRPPGAPSEQLDGGRQHDRADEQGVEQHDRHERRRRTGARSAGRRTGTGSSRRPSPPRYRSPRPRCGAARGGPRREGASPASTCSRMRVSRNTS